MDFAGIVYSIGDEYMSSYILDEDSIGIYDWLGNFAQKISSRNTIHSFSHNMSPCEQLCYLFLGKNMLNTTGKVFYMCLPPREKFTGAQRCDHPAGNFSPCAHTFNFSRGLITLEMLLNSPEKALQPKICLH